MSDAAQENKKASAPVSSLPEFRLWEEHWIRCCKELNQVSFYRAHLLLTIINCSLGKCQTGISACNGGEGSCGWGGIGWLKTAWAIYIILIQVLQSIQNHWLSVLDNGFPDTISSLPQFSVKNLCRVLLIENGIFHSMFSKQIEKASEFSQRWSKILNLQFWNQSKVPSSLLESCFVFSGNIWRNMATPTVFVTLISYWIVLGVYRTGQLWKVFFYRFLWPRSF